jgi:hypothetical protein
VAVGCATHGEGVAIAVGQSSIDIVGAGIDMIAGTSSGGGDNWSTT